MSKYDSKELETEVFISLLKNAERYYIEHNPALRGVKGIMEALISHTFKEHINKDYDNEVAKFGDGYPNELLELRQKYKDVSLHAEWLQDELDKALCTIDELKK
ncbi:MAG: hypothetical protein V4501_11145 [Pseudomonadota bacterium]